MKVLLLPGCLSPEYVCRFARQLSERGHTVIFCAFCDTLTHRTAIESVITHLPPTVTKRFFPLHPWHFHPRNAIRLLQAIWFILRNRPQIIHTQDLDLGSFVVLLALSCFCPSLPVVATIHDITLHAGSDRHFFYQKAQHYLKARAKRLFIFEQNAPLPPAMEKWLPKTVFIPLYVDLTAAYEECRDCAIPEEDVILCFGWISVYKGIEYLIDAVQQNTVRFPTIKLIIAGRTGTTSEDRTYSRHLHARAKNTPWCEIKSRYHTHEETAKLFKRAKIVVLPYKEASQSGIVSLACYFKKPVIATTVGNLPRQVINDRSGILVPPCDSAALAAAVGTLLSDEEKRKRMGAQGHHDFIHDASEKQTLNIITATYHQVVSNENTAP